MNTIPPAPTETPQLAPSPDGGRTLRLEFHGTGAEYFKVWIVNLALSILTLGIFSAWAKVRTRRYFYGNTTLDGAAFDYTASPVAILNGRLIMVAYVIVYTILGNLYPIAQAMLILLTLPALPWVINRSLAFNNRYSGHRGLRFGFEGGYWGAFRAFIAWPLLALVTFGLTWPLAAHRGKRYIVENSRYGQCHFAFNATLSNFYANYAIALALVFGMMVVAGVAVGGLIGVQVWLGGGLGDAGDESGDGGFGLPSIAVVLVITVVTLSYLMVLIVPGTFVQTAITNHLWQTNRLQRDAFDMRMHIGRVLWIQVTNLALIVLSLGLFVPFAKVRMLRYRVSCFAMRMREGPQVYHAGRRDRIGAAGDELGDAFDLELGL